MLNYFGSARYGHFAYATSLEAQIELDIEITTEISDIFFFSDFDILKYLATITVAPQERRVATVHLKRQQANIQLLLPKTKIEVLKRNINTEVVLSSGPSEEFVYAD